MNQPEIVTLTMPVISTGHLTERTAEILLRRGDRNPWVPCARWDFGFFLFIDNPDDSIEEVPQCLLDIRNWIRAEGYTDPWIRLDEAASQIEALPFYDW